MKKLHTAVLVVVLAVFAVGCAQKGAPQSTSAAPVGQEFQTVPVWFADGTQGQLVVPANRARSLVSDTIAMDRAGYTPVGFETPMVRPRAYERAAVDYPVVERPVYRTTPRYRTSAVRPARYNAYGDNVENRTYRQKRSMKKSAMIVGGSAAGGALIGAVAGGKKGAVVGGLSGAGAGLVYDLLTRNKHR